MDYDSNSNCCQYTAYRKSSDDATILLCLNVSLIYIVRFVHLFLSPHVAASLKQAVSYYRPLTLFIHNQIGDRHAITTFAIFARSILAN